jgi:hypothetical protein
MITSLWMQGIRVANSKGKWRRMAPVLLSDIVQDQFIYSLGIWSSFSWCWSTTLYIFIYWVKCASCLYAALCQVGPQFTRRPTTVRVSFWSNLGIHISLLYYLHVGPASKAVFHLRLYTHRPPLGVAAPCAASAGASREAGAVQAPLLSPKPATQFHLLSLAVAATPPIGRSNFIFSSSGRSNLLTLPPRKLTNSPRRTRQIMARPPARPSCPSHGVCSSLCRLRSEK